MRFGLVHNLDASAHPRPAARLRAPLAALFGRHVEVLQADSYAALTQAFARGEVDIAWLAPALVVEAARRAPLALVATVVRAGAPCYAAALVVREAGPLRALEDLRGARAGWVDPWSAAGYLFPRRLLRGAGLDPAGLFSTQRFFGTHHHVAAALAKGEIDVGALHCAPVPGVPGDGLPAAGAGGLRVLARTPAIPGDALCVSARLEGSAVARLAERLCGEPGRALAVQLAADCFVARRLEDYACVREALEDEWGRSSCEPPG